MLISIVIPVYNRERLIDRCLASVFNQAFADYEVIAVDDGSTDASLARLNAHAEPRLKVIQHSKNRGVGPAHNRAIAAAIGDWIVHLDSDDELIPGALAQIADIAVKAPETVDALWFRCQMDDGRLSPDPMPLRQEWDYDGYLGFSEEMRGRWHDVLRCVRRRCFAEIRYADNWMSVDKFHLDFARRFRTRIHSDVVLLYHQDAENQVIYHRRWLDPTRDRALLRDRADGYRAVLQEHGSAIARVAPGQYGDYLQIAATSAVFANRRIAAYRYATQLAVRFPLRGRAWLLMGASLIGPVQSKRFRELARRWRSPASECHIA
jgi:glycosyltransferase involved in cell wall biosynthesis